MPREQSPGSMLREQCPDQCPAQCPGTILCNNVQINALGQYSMQDQCSQELNILYRHNMSTGTILFNLCTHQSTVVPANADQCRSMQVNIGIYSIRITSIRRIDLGASLSPVTLRAPRAQGAAAQYRCRIYPRGRRAGIGL